MTLDSTISVQNILVVIGALAAVLLALHRFTMKHAESLNTVTNALNNLSKITDDMKAEVEEVKVAVKTQNGRLASVETQLLVESEVRRRIQEIGRSEP